MITGGQHTQVEPYVILWSHRLGTEVGTKHHVRMVTKVALKISKDDQISYSKQLLSDYLYPLLIVTDGQEQNLAVVIVVFFSKATSIFSQWSIII